MDDTQKVTVIITAVVMYLITVIAYWKLFQKAGEKGWKALVPIYNEYILFKIVGLKSWFWITMIIGVVGSAVLSLNGFNNSMTAEQIKNYDFAGHPFVPVTLGITFVISVIAQVKLAGNLARAFKKGTGFAIFSFIFRNLSVLILAFSKSAKYDKKAVNA